MSLKSCSALEDFTSNRKAENIITGIGIDLTHNFFKQNKLLDPFKENILILGEGLHTVHPVAGQGFNLVLRDINKLQKIFKYYTELGMSLKSTPALEEFTSNRKSENIITGIGIDLTHNFFKQNKLLDPFKEKILKNISKNNTLKRISKFISNQGLSI